MKIAEKHIAEKQHRKTHHGEIMKRLRIMNNPSKPRDPVCT